MLKKGLIASSALLLSLAAHVQAEGAYVGLSLGQSDVDASGFDDGNSIAVSGGYRVNNNLALEAAYIDLGEADNGPFTLEADGFNFSAVGILPVNQQIEVFAKLGLFAWDASLHRSGYGQVASDDGVDLSLGFGASAQLNQQFSVVVEYQLFELDSDDVSNLSLGARYHF